MEYWFSRVTAVLALLAACSRAATFNNNYFTFPLKSDEVPEVHNGDTLNVTWKSGYDQAILYHWCGQTLMQEFPGLGGDGTQSFIVNTSWTSPCHWQYVNQENIATFLDSGFVDVTNIKATPAVTWAPTSSGVACGIQTVTTTNNAGKTITSVATSEATATSASNNTAANVSASTTAACDNQLNTSGLITGPGIGVGVAIGALVAGLTAAGWALLVRRHSSRQRAMAMHSRDPHEGYPRSYELPYSARPVEIESSRDSRSRFAELPSEDMRNK
ncbi:hypothetical protein MPH_07773 [Macrophomina phaseolina MS6]|uniref:Uncharacterized protein n=1 Tax=Macrophomina phaseolina (strain MS6) TaxID=1126212 RepID=K2SE15_MACPH|nr:hypothetical protein MPH_07773 [Macrophomina phaseolina MS6]